MAVTTTAPSGSAIAADGRRYAGAGYVYGGTGARPGDWDCSSFASYVLGHDLGMGLPGGSWAQVTSNGTVHGPVVMSYVTWSGADPVPAGQEQPGDLACFAGLGTGGHMGIVLGPNLMVSALDSSQGTLISPIQGYGPAGAPLVYRRVKGTGPTPPGGGGGVGTTAAQSANLLVPVLFGAAVGVGMVGLVVGGAALVGLTLVWLFTRVARSAVA